MPTLASRAALTRAGASDSGRVWHGAGSTAASIPSSGGSRCRTHRRDLEAGGMRQLAQLTQAAFILAAALAVYAFITAARDGERRRLCAPLCHLRPNYAARNRTAPDFERPSIGPK